MYKEKGRGSWMEKQINDTGEKEMNFTIIDLTPSSEYIAFMISHSIIGSSGSTENITFTTSQLDGESEMRSNTGSVAGGVVGGLVGLLVIMLLVVILRKYDMKCTCVRKKESTSKALNIYETPKDALRNNGIYENSQALRQNDHDSIGAGDGNTLDSNAYEITVGGESDFHHYSELRRQPHNDITHEYENTSVQCDKGKAVYVNTKFGYS
ncbi:hypothetical protein DPMN_079484 [Dreissena polymorpha]|uniref:Fibronectin type-III domain-containing protein n=1 Tax=Dreissena polymorpha TaxID=45954 RepID=A0A9D3YUJ5_DREPO|nr:hypothetical protein DPMN_079484 [Dreissena polymorpha]